MKARQEGREPDIKLMESAVEYLKSAVRINPQYTKAHALLGDILFRFGQYDEAKKHLETVLLYEKEGKSAAAAKALLRRIPSQQQ